MMSIYPIVRIQFLFGQLSLLCYDFCILSKTECKSIYYHFRRDNKSSSFRKLPRNKWICRESYDFFSHVYYLIRGFIASTRAFNLLTHAFNLPTQAFNLATRAFSLLIREFERVPSGFELVTREFELVTRESEFKTRGFELVARTSELVTRNTCFTFPLNFRPMGIVELVTVSLQVARYFLCEVGTLCLSFTLMVSFLIDK